MSKIISRMKTLYEGSLFETKDFGYVEVMEYHKASKVLVKFLNTGTKEYFHSSAIRDGAIRDRFAPTVYGVGIIGDEVVRENGGLKKEYDTWSGMLERCYSERLKQVFPTYENCYASEDFKHFSKFKNWYFSQKGCEEVGWSLDKDLLIKGNKMYSSETCILLPSEVNVVIVPQKSIRGKYPIGVYFKGENRKFCASMGMGKRHKHIGYFENQEEAFQAYKQAKETYVKSLAEKWKGFLDERAYYALNNFVVDIDD